MRVATVMKLLQIRNFVLFCGITKGPDITETKLVIVKLDSKIQDQFWQLELCSFFHKHPPEFCKRQTCYEIKENEVEKPQKIIEISIRAFVKKSLSQRKLLLEHWR